MVAWCCTLLGCPSWNALEWWWLNVKRTYLRDAQITSLVSSLPHLQCLSVPKGVTCQSVGAHPWHPWCCHRVLTSCYQVVIVICAIHWYLDLEHTLLVLQEQLLCNDLDAEDIMLHFHVGLNCVGLYDGTTNVTVNLTLLLLLLGWQANDDDIIDT